MIVEIVVIIFPLRDYENQDYIEHYPKYEMRQCYMPYKGQFYAGGFLPYGAEMMHHLLSK